MRGNKSSASGVSPKEVQSNERRKRERERERRSRAKVSVNNGQYIYASTKICSYVIFRTILKAFANLLVLYLYSLKPQKCVLRDEYRRDKEGSFA